MKVVRIPISMKNAQLNDIIDMNMFFYRTQYDIGTTYFRKIY